MKTIIHIISFLLLIASLIIWLQGCRADELEVPEDFLMTSAEDIRDIDKIIPPVAGTFDLKFFLACTAAILELIGGICGAFVAQKKISTKSLAIKQLVTGVAALKLLEPDLYHIAKACQFAVQTGHTSAFVASAKSDLAANGGIEARSIDKKD